MKKTPKLLALLLCLAMCLAFLTGCDGDTGATTGTNDGGVITVANSPDESTEDDADKTPLDAVTDITFDCDTMAYSFTGAANAEFYYVKVFALENGEEGSTAELQSDKIDATTENTYSGTIENETLLAGDYVIHVVASASGYKSSDASVEGKSTMMASASVSANWNTDDPENTTVKITITAGDEIAQSFTLKVMKDGSEVYSNEAATAGEIILTAADLGAESLSTEDSYSVSVTVNEVSGYTAPSEAATADVTEAMQWGPGS